MTESLIYKVRGLDCANEVSVLRETVGMLTGVKGLDFDILKGKMTVTIESPLVGEGAILKAIKQAGLEAFPWQDNCSCSNCTVEGVESEKKRIFLSCFLGGIFLLTGFVYHGISHNSFLHAFVVGESEKNHFYPLFTIIFYIASMVFSGRYILPKAFASARNLRLDMNFLMSLAVIGALIINQWMEGAMVLFLFAMAQLLEAWSIGRARRAINALMDLSPQKARCVNPHDGNIKEKPVEEVYLDEILLVRPGEKIPLDGIVTRGTTSVNQSPITGESVPVIKETGDEVFAGTINEEGSFEFKVTKKANNTTLSRIITMVEEAQSRRAPAEQWIEKFAAYYTPFMIFFAVAISTILPLFFSVSWAEGFYRGLVILVISCPCALVISTPVSIVSGITSAARNGVLIKGGAYPSLRDTQGGILL